jgi:hypothetical protein
VKVVFLDIDGVLNDNDYRLGKPQIMPAQVEAFNRIISATGAQIVLSSSWRSMVYKNWMTVRGFAALIESHGVRGWLLDCTPEPGQFDTRGEEILAWLAAKEAERPVKDSLITHWVALDDWDDEMVALGDRFVQCDGGRGITLVEAQKAIAILNGPPIERPLPRPPDSIDQLMEAL